MHSDLLLQHITKHISLSDEQKEILLGAFNTKKLRKKQFLSQEGDTGKGPAFVTRGILRTYSLDKNGVEHILQFAPAGWWVGDIKSINTQQPGTLFIDAVEDTEIIWIYKSMLDKLFINIPALERFFRILAENALINYQERLVGNLSFSAMERYNAFCTKYPSLTECLPQKYVASYIGVTPEFLSKMLKNAKV
jgi:CRP/FNR family transcriptional regulator, anaerobic regulatory protein